MAIDCGLITLSDKGAVGQREDTAGAAITQIMRDAGHQRLDYTMIPDEAQQIEQTLIDWCDSGRMGLILTCGGTGLSPRDVTPEATLRVIQRAVPGFAEAMRAASLRITPHAMLSRSVSGVRGQTLIINLPGSRKAAIENLEVVLPALAHAVDKLRGDPADCAIG